MSYRYPNAIIKPGLNTLVSPAPQYTYYLYSWGRGNTGQLGLGNTTNYSSPKQVGALTNWSFIPSISWYSTHMAATKTDGTMWTWGSGANGTLGLGNTTNYSSPKQVGALTNWASVAIALHTLAVKTDGTLWGWGKNNAGQLGLGDTTNRSSPVQIGALTSWLKVAASYASTAAAGFSLAIKTDGTLWAWGDNTNGQLGLGNTTKYSSPKQVGSLTNWLTIAISGVSSAVTALAVKTDGTMWSWGQNNFGNLGLGNRTNYSSPKQIGALTTWLKIASSYHSLAVKTDGTLWSWGYNVQGQLGTGNTTYYSSPKQVGSLTTWLDVSAGGYFSLSTKTDGTLWSWGKNNFGQLGLGNITYRSSPVQVGSLTNWGQIGAVYDSSYSLAY
jgi:alpha-tubulin suppressor-like RCC1 family protein